MFNYTQAFSGFSVDDIHKAKAFYGELLGLKIAEEGDSLRLQFDDGTQVFVYPKGNHTPATYTMLNFTVEDIDKAVQELKDKGVEFEHYPGTDTGEDGISRAERGPKIAWFKDPAGNILSVLED